MKLVQLLAKELKEWPEGVTHLTQSEVDNEIYNALDENSEDSAAPLKNRFDTNGRHSESPYPIVTREQWQSEREKMNKPKWIRHRGGKCPVPCGTKVETRHRDGNTYSPHFHTQNSRSEVATNVVWKHQGDAMDIMAYRVIEETKDQEIEEVETIDTAKTPTIEYAFGDKDSDPKDLDWKQLGTLTYKLEIDATEATQRIDSLVAKWGQIVSPLKWRDAIIHCQAIIEDCEREIQRNVNLLDAEGLMMQKDSKKAMQHYAPDVDMSDWRNWQAGDVIEIVANEGSHQFENGEEVIVVFLDLNDTDMSVKAKYKDGSDYWWLSGKDAKFIRRP